MISTVFKLQKWLCRTGREVGPGHGVVQQSQQSVPLEIRETDWQLSADRLTDSQQREAACRSLTLPRRLGARGSGDEDQEGDTHFYSLPRPKTSKV